MFFGAGLFVVELRLFQGTLSELDRTLGSILKSLQVDLQKWSDRNIQKLDELIEEFGLDQTRYFLMAEVPFGNDGNFARENMINRVNADLANNLGNLVQRTLSMIQKNCDGVVPEPGEPTVDDERQLRLMFLQSLGPCLPGLK